MIEFVSIASQELKGRGTVITVANRETKERDLINNNLRGAIVSIDAIVYKIKGVLSFARPMLYEGEEIGLLVEKK